MIRLHTASTTENVKKYSNDFILVLEYVRSGYEDNNNKGIYIVPD